MKFGVIVFPGSNCDTDCYFALRDVIGVKVDYIWHTNQVSKDYDCLLLPGGFSYGDYLRPGIIARFSSVMRSVIEFARSGGLVLGICNGFQILLEAGLLPGAMLQNRSLRFICKYVHLKVENKNTPFTRFDKSILRIPIAHKQGNYFIDPDGLKRLRDNQQIVFRYCTPEGAVTEEANPNGAVDNIAGIINEQGNVLGMMPHPERASEAILGSTDGRLIFESICNFLQPTLAGET
ncbi:phosphoribosylformylglycinamidine synthase subunit PurQ [Candidatus Sumerlaeota bacterium]|nr:phosphoribosylformylglycinamidine synthase subunit PurQ [Candidatus Sumerlaeota bacterium]